MRLVHYDLNNKESDVQVGFQFDHDGKIMEVAYMPEPHKPSSQGKVSCAVADDPEDMGDEYYAGVWSMKWIEREDQGWIHPEIELRNVINMYEDMYDDDISGLNLTSVVDLVQQVDLEHLSKYPECAIPMLNWLEKNSLPEMLKRQAR